MEIIETNFKGLKIYKKKTYVDKRGYTRELFNNRYFKKKFPFDLISLSKKNVIRGLHLQTKKPQAKFITVLSGKIFDVAVDCRIKSKTFGEYFSFILSENKNESLYIPEGFAHGYYVISETAEISYKCSEIYQREEENGIIWNDPDIAIEWPGYAPILSERDHALPLLKSFNESTNT